MSSNHRIAPDHDLKGWPSGIKYIVGNEAAERFSFYGMKAILYVYLTLLIQTTGLLEAAAKADATSKVHLFIAGVYAFPILGALVADKLLGKYQTIIWLSLVYCLGHAFLAIFEGSLSGTYAGLALISVGSGGIKPCVSAHVGDQFGKSNWHLIKKVFQLFYFMINFGSLFAQLAIPFMYAKWGAGVAFGLPGILMAIATLLFWLGRNDFVHVPASPGGRLGFLDVIVGFLLFVPLFMLLFGPAAGVDVWWWRVGSSAAAVALGLTLFDYRQKIQEDNGFLAVLIYSLKAKLVGVPKHELGDPVPRDPDSDIASHAFFGPACAKYGAEAAEGPRAVLRIISVFCFVSVFWMLFDQHASTWIEQADQMDRDLGFFGWTFLPSQVSFINPAMVMVLIPISIFWLFPAFERRGIVITPLRKMSAGMLLAGVSFVAVGLLQQWIESVGVGKVSVYWQFGPYLLLTFSEVLVSVTGLEFAYTQAPRRMKSVVMGFWLVFIAIGNWLVSLLAHAWEGWALSTSFFAFAAMMFAAGILFTVRALFYTYKEYPQE